MPKRVLLGIDCGGTHTDAVLLVQEEDIRVRFGAKVPTQHEDLPASIRAVLAKLSLDEQAASLLQETSAVTLGTTLAVNAIVQGKADKVGLVLSAGPGLSPLRFTVGDYAVCVPGGLDHRGVEVESLDLSSLDGELTNWRQSGVAETACVGKFSPRNPAHECAMAAYLEEKGFHPCLGHRLSGELNFPRRIATAYYNAAVKNVHNAFLDAVESALASFHINAQVRLLKADGGSVPLALSRKEPVASILSGPAASVMGIVALCPEIDHGVTLLLDIGGTTTDISYIVDGSPVVDRFGMLLEGRRTLVRALASQSIGVGGDSRIRIDEDKKVHVGPHRDGPAMAFGGEVPTLLDALNYQNRDLPEDTGDRIASKKGIEALAARYALSPLELSEKAINSALSKIKEATRSLLHTINMHPIYTLKALKSKTAIQPERIVLVGGPAACLCSRLEAFLELPVLIPRYADVANAIGACLTKPTSQLEVYADTGKRLLRAPMLEHTEELSRSATLTDVEDRCEDLLRTHLQKNAINDAEIEVLESNLFSTLDEYGASSKDLRVTCQVVPGILGRPSHADCAL